MTAHESWQFSPSIDVPKLICYPRCFPKLLCYPPCFFCCFCCCCTSLTSRGTMESTLNNWINVINIPISDSSSIQYLYWDHLILLFWSNYLLPGFNITILPANGGASDMSTLPLWNNIALLLLIWTRFVLQLTSINLFADIISPFPLT